MVLSKHFFDNYLIFIIHITKITGQSLGIFLRDGDPFNDETEYVISQELIIYTTLIPEKQHNKIKQTNKYNKLILTNEK